MHGASNGESGEHAVVIGASFAGLVAARALRDHFTRVTLVERDRFPEEPSFRHGVPQTRHVHVTLARCQQALEGLFPGIEGELEKGGVPEIDWGRGLAWHTGRGWVPRFPSQVKTRLPSRDLLDWVLRGFMAGFDNVHFETGVEVVELLTDDDRSEILGVRVRPRGQGPEEGAEPTELRADLVVDTSGRLTKTLDWLVEMGYDRPRETVVNSFLGYASRYYRRPSEGFDDWQVLWVNRRFPDIPRMGIIVPAEGDRWWVTLAGVAHHYPPTDEEGFLDFARRLVAPELYEALKAAEPLSPIAGFRRTENRLRHYEELTRWPRRFLVMGDAVCSLNPVYAQGMTVASLQCLALQELLAEEEVASETFTRRFRDEMAKAAALPWGLATREDCRWPETEGGEVRGTTRFLHWYVNQVMRRVLHDPEAARTFVEQLHMIRPPTSLFRPRILFPALLGGVFRRADSPVAVGAGASVGG